MGLHCRGVRIVADGSKLSAAKGKVEGKREEKRVYKPSFGVVRIPEERRSVDRPSTLPGLHCRHSTPFIGVPVGPHTVIPTERSTFEKRAHLYLLGQKREKRRETRQMAREIFPPDRTNDPSPTYLLLYLCRISNQPFPRFSRFSSSEKPQRFSSWLIRSKRNGNEKGREA